MTPSVTYVLALGFVSVLWSGVLGLHRPPPRYSQQYMPETSFTCRNKIVGSYYADPETDCQLFHVCVSVAGTVQDYRFLCPNDTAFDQESQTCADWYDVDCEAATLYYASDNFDLYRIGSGLESLHYDSIRSDAEPQDHLQRSESNDPVRSPNSLNRVAATSFKSSGDGFYNNRKSTANNNNNAKEINYEAEKPIATPQEPKKKAGVRKISRKQPLTENTSNYTPSTAAPQTTRYNVQRAFPSTTARPVTTQQTTAHVKNNFNAFAKKETSPTSSTTHRPTTAAFSSYASTYRPSSNYQDASVTTKTYQAQSTTAKPTTVYSNHQNTYGNQQNNANTISTARPSTSAGKNDLAPNYPAQFLQTTTPESNVASNSYPFGYQQRSFSTVPRVGGSSTVYPSTTVGTSYYDSFQSDSNISNIRPSAAPQRQSQSHQAQHSHQQQNNHQQQQQQNHQQQQQNHQQQQQNHKQQQQNHQQQQQNHQQQQQNHQQQQQNHQQQHNHQQQQQHNHQQQQQHNHQQQQQQNTAKQHSTGFSASSYTPTTYSPVSKKVDNGQYFEKKRSSIETTKYYDTTEPSKKASKFSGKYYETSTGSYDFGKSSAVIGFSPSSINHLAESPRTTTPTPRRAISSTTYSPNTFETETRRSAPPKTTSRGTTYVSESARPFSTTAKFAADGTTPRPKSAKKNDYDYAYYDNGGAAEEYESLDLDKESSKISRN